MHLVISYSKFIAFLHCSTVHYPTLYRIYQSHRLLEYQDLLGLFLTVSPAFLLVSLVICIGMLDRTGNVMPIEFCLECDCSYFIEEEITNQPVVNS